ncbi:vitamin B12 dependent-methionine synthase activation domain-containing protein [Alistipes provencensis]|uniref:vitamin B12 dependent-methionine synthase activation domain-containing protein n=1 Tax=Alistipes provencensis TaxID=1816676 RepID=UPI0007EC505E|nr:vitamin B12 dependent-methionine synthase activation domain-containing protein [Alistipes provencensis]
MLERGEAALDSLDVSDDEIYRTMGYRGSLPDAAVREVVREVRAEIAALCVPRYMFQVLEAELLPRRHVRAGGVEFAPGGIIGSYLPGMSHVCLFVATAGREYDAYLHRLKAEGDILKEFVADSVGSVVAEACVTLVGRRLDAECDLRRSLPYSPGYCGWNICEQQKLFSLFPDEPCGIVLSDSFLMSPVKSVSGFFGLGRELRPQPYHCEICTNQHCYKRKETNL